MKNSIKIKDRITIKCGNQISTAHNALVHYAELLTSENGFAQFIRVGNSTASVVSGGISAKPCSLSERNFVASQGNFFVYYDATFTDEDIAEGVEITEASLSATTDGYIVNQATLSPVKKIAGEDLAVRVELVIDSESDVLEFVDGENSLIRALLGCESLDLTAFSFASGKNYHPTTVMERGDSLVVEEVPCEATLVTGELSLSARLSTMPHEAILLYKNRPVLRGIYIYDLETTQATATLRSNLSFEHTGKQVAYLHDIKRNGEPVTDFKIKSKIVAITRDCPQLLGQSLPRDSKLLGEPTGKFFAVVTNKEVQVYRYYNDEIVSYYKTPRLFDGVVLVSNGSVVFYGDRLVITTLENGSVQTYQTPFGRILQCEVTIEDGLYHIAFLNSARAFCRYTYALETNESVLLEEILDVAEDFGTCRRDEHFIDYWSKTSAVYGCACLHGTNSATVSNIKTVATSTTMPLKYRSGRWFRRGFYQGTRSYIGLIEGGRVVSSIDDPDCEIIGLNELAIVTLNGAVKRIITYGGTYYQIADLEFGSLQAPDYAVEIGKYLLFYYLDGRLLTLYTVEEGKVVWCNDCASGDNVTYEVVTLVDPMEKNASAIAVTTLLELGG